jgi:hypothetical protein
MGEQVYSIEDVRDALKDRVITVVAERTGLHRETLYNLTNGRQKGMNLDTYTKLVEYLFDEKKKDHA